MGEGNDPDEVTVQLDTPHPAKGAGTSASDAPVFVDASGRRGRTFRRIGILAGLACAAYAVVIVATLLSGNAGAPWLPVPGPDDDPPAGRVETTRGPSASAATSGAPGFAAPRSPGVSASAGVPSRSASGGPSASGSAAAPTGSAAARPSASGSPRASTAPSTSPSDPGPSSPVVGGGSSSAEPPSSSPATSPSPESSPSSAGGANTVADGAPHPAPVAADRGV